MRLGVLVSGSGTILQSMLERRLPVAAVASDRRCRGLLVAADAGIPTVVVDRLRFGGFGPGFDRRAYTEAIVAELEPYRLDLVAMAGFGTVLAASIHRRYPGRILNTHPALLPDFPGWHAVADALAAGAEVTGCTVHVATVEMDAGPVLAQREVPVHPGDTVESLHERIKEVERHVYPDTVAAALDALAAGRLPDGTPVEVPV